MNNLFGIKDLIPHGYCLSWSPILLWLHVTSDLLIALAYYSIPLMLVYFLRKRKDLPYQGLIIMFAGFIVACGTTHLLSAITIWIPLYWLDGFLKGFTAIISVATAVLMLWVIPRVLSLPSNVELQVEIQQRKVAQEALRLSENKLATILDSVEAFIYIKDSNYQYQYANEPVRQLFGKALEDIIHNSDEAFFDEATTAKLHENDRRVIELGERIASENLYTLKDKANPHSFLTIKRPLRREDGSIYGLCGISTDISERKQLEEHLRDSNAFKVSILDSLTSHIAVLDAQGFIIDVNNAWRWFAKENGLPKSSLDMQGVNYLDVCRNAVNKPYGDEASAACDGINAVIKGALETFDLEYPCHSPNQHRWFHLKVSPLQGSLRGVVVSHENITEQKQATQLLIKLKAMTDISLDGFWMVDLMGNILQVNKAYAKMTGYSIDELLSMPVSQLEALEDQEQIKAHIEKVVVQGYDLFETRHRHKDGHLIDIEISVTLLSEFQQFCVLCRDITKRKLLEKELKLSELKFRSIIEFSPVPMALLNHEQMSITFVNPAFMQIFGYNIADIPTLADWWTKAYPDPIYRQWVQTAWQKAMEKAKQEQTAIPPLELVICCKNSSIKNAIVSGAEIHDSTNLYLLILYDITPRKQMEAKLNAIFNASVEGIITVDMSGSIVSANAAVETIFGYNPEELMDSSIIKLIPSSPKEMNDGHLPYAVNRVCHIQEVEGIHKNCSMVPLDLSIAEYSIDNVYYFTYIVRDVSLRKHQEDKDRQHLEQLAHVTRLGLLGEMASGIAHEVNQPLTAIATYAQVSLNLIKKENPDLIKLAEIIVKTQQQALRAGSIIHRMKAFGKSFSNQHVTANINTLIDDAIDLCIVDLKQNGVTLDLELTNNLPPVFVDPIQIEQIIINLIRNSTDALQSLPENQQRKITIQSQLTLNNDIQVSVKDNGLGITEDQKQNILTPFFTTKISGTGMGLSISRSLIEAHEGTLYFNSEFGKGSTFYFTLPIETTEREDEREY